MSCATVPCDQVKECALGRDQCVVKNFPGMQPHQQLQRRLSARAAEGLKENAPAENGIKPARTDAHPGAKTRNRKELEWAGRK